MCSESRILLLWQRQSLTWSAGDVHVFLKVRLQVKDMEPLEASSSLMAKITVSETFDGSLRRSGKSCSSDSTALLPNKTWVKCATAAAGNHSGLAANDDYGPGGPDAVSLPANIRILIADHRCRMMCKMKSVCPISKVSQGTVLYHPVKGNERGAGKHGQWVQSDGNKGLGLRPKKTKRN